MSLQLNCTSSTAKKKAQTLKRNCAIRINRKHYFTLNLFRELTSTCFKQAYCSSSGGTTLYTANGMCHAFMLAGS